MALVEEVWLVLRKRLVVAAVILGLAVALAGPASAAATPSVKRVEPGQGPGAGGTAVTLTGTKLGGATDVRFGSTRATSFTVNSETSITAVSPAFIGGSAIVDVTVTTPEGTSPITTTGTPFSESDLFDYAPRVTRVEPNNGPAAGGTAVTIEGTGFAATFKRGTPPACWVCNVKFGSNEASSVKVVSETLVTAVAPAGTATVDVTVETLAGTSPINPADRFSYASSSTPHYTSNGPNVGGEPVTTIGWGTVTLKRTKGGVPGAFITCHVATAGTVANPGGGDPATDKVPGSGLTQTFAPYDCESEGICPMGTTPRLLGEPNAAANFTGSLPWTDKLGIVGGVVRQEMTHIKVFVGCFVGAKCEGGIILESNETSISAKGLMPVSKHGTSALHPGFLEYGPDLGNWKSSAQKKRS